MTRLVPVRLLLPLLAALAGPPPAASHEAHAVLPSGIFAAEELHPARVTLVDQTGAPHPFRDEIIGDGPVVITFVYSSCTTVCPVANAIFEMMQTDLDARDDTRTRLVSITVDPRRDTPERLAAMAADFGAGPRWSFWTGGVGDVEEALRSMGVPVGRVEDHDPMFLVRGARDQDFVRVLGLPEPDELFAVLDGSDSEPSP